MVVGDVLGGPAALGLVEPEGVDADAALDVRDPVDADVDDGGEQARGEAHEQHADPAGPGVVQRHRRLPQVVAAPPLQDAVAEAVARQVLQPVDGVEVAVVVVGVGRLAAIGAIGGRQVGQQVLGALVQSWIIFIIYIFEQIISRQEK